MTTTQYSNNQMWVWELRTPGQFRLFIGLGKSVEEAIINIEKQFIGYDLNNQIRRSLIKELRETKPVMIDDSYYLIYSEDEK